MIGLVRCVVRWFAGSEHRDIARQVIQRAQALGDTAEIAAREQSLQRALEAMALPPDGRERRKGRDRRRPRQG